MVQTGHAKPVMPVGPRALVELPALRMRQNVNQSRVTQQFRKFMCVGIVAQIHHLRNDTLGHGNGFVGRLPPNVFASEPFQYALLNGPNDHVCILTELVNFAQSITHGFDIVVTVLLGLRQPALELLCRVFNTATA